MQRKLQEFQDFHKRVKSILFLLCLELFIIVLTIISASVTMRFSKPLTLTLLSINIVCLAFTVYYAIKCRDMVYHLENLIFDAHSVLAGADFIQGYDTAKPNPVLIRQIPQDILAQLQDINNRNYGEGTMKKLYETKGEYLLSPVALALEMFTDIVILESEIHLQGNQGMVANISIIIPDHHSCKITLDYVNLRGNEKPSIILGKNCKVILNLIGDNFISYDGIRVPETSDLEIIGECNMILQVERTNCVGIGGTTMQAYGNITLATTGIIKVINSSNISIGIGGGHNLNNSLIHFLSGNIYVETSGYNTVGIGSISGNARIDIEDGKVKIITNGTKSVGIGSLQGFVDIKSSGNLIIKCDGKNAIAIGSLNDSDGRIIIRDGISNIRFNSNKGSGIGALGGKVNIDILSGDLTIYGEGNDIVGIGEHTGMGDIRIQNGTISIQLYGTNAIPICNIRRSVIIDGGNIQCDFPKDITPVNSYGTPLVARMIMDTDEFIQTIDTVDYSYEYHASYSERYPYIKVYLPDGIRF